MNSSSVLQSIPLDQSWIIFFASHLLKARTGTHDKRDSTITIPKLSF
jgi:hypothetical protein